MSTKKLISSKALSMGTSISIHIVSSHSEVSIMQKIERMMTLIRDVESVCSRFDHESELSRLCLLAGKSVPVSDTLFELVRFSLELAALTNGRFDPCIGGAMLSRGFNRHYLTGMPVSGWAQHEVQASYRDITLDEQNKTITLHKPILLDLGAVAKGFAIDLAVQEAQQLDGFLIEAGGDLFAGGLNAADEPWSIGIQHPLQKDNIIGFIRVSDGAVCTSGGYERPIPHTANEHHLLDPLTGHSPLELLSCTVTAPFTMLADAFSTAAFILGPDEGVKLLQMNELEGFMVLPDLSIQTTAGFKLE